ncbi:MAG TPA: ATP-binding protein [Candidatus Nanoarchaeia archaeon]|nr:ATP-binding protein [Candidatus Nanoarchaeia archaeon]
MLTNPLHSLTSHLAEQSQILLIVGSRGSGKTATALFIAERVHFKYPRKKIYLINYPSPQLLPDWIHHEKNTENVPNNSLLIIDEAALEFGARQSMSAKSKDLAGLLPILRHKDQSAIFITQNTGLSDVNLVRLVDSILIKKPSLLQVKTERSAMKQLLESAQNALMGKDKSHAYLIADEQETLIQTPLPGFWTTRISKGWSAGEVQEEKHEISEPFETKKPDGKPYTPNELWRHQPEEKKHKIWSRFYYLYYALLIYPFDYLMYKLFLKKR